MPSAALTVAVTGPTGDLGLGIMDALERSRAVKRIVAMARRPFDPADRGWRKTEYRQGDVTDTASVRALVENADVVVHLAFAILSASDATHELNVAGSRRVFEESAKAGVKRICYASSVAAYGFHDDNPDWLTEQVPPRGSPEHPYSQQKAEVEGVLGEVLLKHPGTVAYAFRPCIVAGPEAQTMLKEIPYLRLGAAMPDSVARLLDSLPVLKPVIPDPGARFQLVHEDDVARAFVAGVRGLGEPGPYNLAASGTLTMSDLASALGWYSVPVPKLAVETTAEIATRLPLVPDSIAWLHSVRKPVLMRTARAKKLLGWRPKYTARRTLDEMITSYRALRYSSA
jgi:UDP-glucose 4-epimerase